MTTKLNHPGVAIPAGRPRTDSEWSLAWWRRRHGEGYFPTMEWHRDWKICPYPPPHFLDVLYPTAADVALEIGCGYGEWMVPAAPHVGRIYGIDIHPVLAEKARETFAKHAATNCEYRTCDGLSIPYGDATFTIVYAVSVFQHIPRATVRRYFEEANRVLQPGGRWLFHFREANGRGPYSRDIGVDHNGDFSVGWTQEEATLEVERIGEWELLTTIGGTADGSLFIHGVKRGGGNAKRLPYGLRELPATSSGDDK